MNQLNFVVVPLLLFILSGCSPALATPSNQLGSQETATQASPIQTETRALMTPTQTLSSTVSMQRTAEVDFVNNYVDLTPTAFESVMVDGFLVLKNLRAEDYFFYDMRNQKIVEIGNNHEKITSILVSPNRKLMLVGACPIDKCNYSLQAVDQIITTKLPTEDDWVLAGWLDNERVVFLTQLKPGQPVQPQNQVIYNVFTGEKNSLQLYLPNPQTLNIRGGKLEDLFVASVCPSLSCILFSDQSNRLVLWDLDTQEEMASLPLTDFTGPLRIDGWSPDGKKFVTTSPHKFQVDAYGKDIWAANELFMFEMDGNLTQLTHYNETLPFATIFNPQWQWSPDNRHIAFWLTIGDDASRPKNLQQWLAVFDTTTFETTLYLSNSSTVSSSIVWSPDGQQLIVSDWDSNLTLIDLARETQSSIPETQNMMIWDWMTH